MGYGSDLQILARINVDVINQHIQIRVTVGCQNRSYIIGCVGRVVHGANRKGHCARRRCPATISQRVGQDFRTVDIGTRFVQDLLGIRRDA